MTELSIFGRTIPLGTHTHLACSFISSHLQADCGLVKRLVRLSLWVIQMSPGAISGHSSLTSAFICPHLAIEKIRDIIFIIIHFKKFPKATTDMNQLKSHLQSNHTLTSLHFLIIKVAGLLVRILYANVDFCVHTFGFCL